MESFPLPEQKKKKKNFYTLHTKLYWFSRHMTDDGAFWMFLRANKQFNAHGNKLKHSCEIILYSIVILYITFLKTL